MPEAPEEQMIFFVGLLHLPFPAQHLGRSL